MAAFAAATAFAAGIVGALGFPVADAGASVPAPADVRADIAAGGVRAAAVRVAAVRAEAGQSIGRVRISPVDTNVMTTTSSWLSTVIRLR